MQDYSKECEIMGRCYKCKKPILYNSYQVIKGVVYCLKCKPEERITTKLLDTVSDAKLDFDEFQSAMKDVALIAVNEPPSVEKKPKKRKRSKKKTKKVN